MTDVAIERSGAPFARGKSVQTYGTPRDFLVAVEHRFGPLAWDLAATAENARAPLYFGPDKDNEALRDALAFDWNKLRGTMWLNPPFGHIAPWAAKCAATRLLEGSRILLLVPASIGANWFAEHVHQRAYVLALQGRLTFDGHTQSFPKDLILAVYGWGPGFGVWSWRDDANAAVAP